ncbi:cyclic lactone autoinducer peptide [Clostridiaceae bacterium]|nr:cyclic lactone autoinducer peptide [Clostridiaceae bacterium]RKJ83001.1 cyclic lactone autoinducer peptide [Butyricicoccus sp. 1XD8-22]
MAAKITAYFVRNGILQEKQSELFTYALRDTFHQSQIVCIILGIGILLGYPGETIAFLVAFPLLRRYCGGLHAVSPRCCTVSTICLYGVALWMSLNVDSTFLIIGTAIAAALIYHYAPVEHTNNILNLRQKRKFRQYGQCIVTVLSCTAIGIAIYMDSSVIAMVLCTIVINGFQLAIQKKPVWSKLEVKKHLLYSLTACVFFIGISSMQSACRNWSYQPEITASLRKYMDN